MMTRNTMGDEMNGTPDEGKTPMKERREKPSGSTPAANVQGGGKSKNGNAMAKNVMGHGERCAVPQGHVMGKC